MKKIHLTLVLLFAMAFSKAQVVSIPDINFKLALIQMGVDTNNDNLIQQSEANAITSLSLGLNNILDFTGLNSFTNLVNLRMGVYYSTNCECWRNIGSSNVNTLNLSNLSNLEFVHLGRFNALSNINFNGCSSLKTIITQSEQDSNGNVINLNFSNLTNLEYVDFGKFNSVQSVYLQNCNNLKTLILSSSSITNFDISNHQNIERLIFRNVYSGALSNLNVLGCNNLKELWIQENYSLESLNLSGLQNLEILNAQYYGWSGNYQNSLLNSLDLLGCTSLKEINVSKASLSSINLQSCLNLEKLICGNNSNLTTLNLSGLNLLNSLVSNNCSLNNLYVNNCPSLQTLQCQNNQLTSLDLSSCGNLQSVNCDNNNLEYVSFKNNTNETKTFLNNPDLTYICADDAEQWDVQLIINLYEMYDTCVVGDYCSFNPNGNYNTISGNTLYDNENDGCDTNDEAFEFLRVNLSDGTNSGSTFTNFEGDYTFYMNAGTFTLTPQLENPTYFNVSPTTANFSFTDNLNNTASQDFCITPNGVHHDVEVVLALVNPARPGFDAEYSLVYKNKGNQPLSGAVSVAFDDAKLDFVSSSVIPTSNTTGSLSWNYSNLLPFENRNITFTLNVNSPQETPAVNNGDVLTFTANITPLTGDEIAEDNTFVYNQIVVGSYDPNDIYCLEGESLDPNMIGKYLHYNVRFENTGTYEAENVVVATNINPAEYDLNSMQVLNASHNVYTRINGNLVEFIFENIQLAGSPAGGHGHVLFKMKSLNSLQTNDDVTSNANIFFDYNFPIETNDATTIFEALSNQNFTKDNSVKVYPNPAKENVTISAKTNLSSITIYDAQGRIIQFVKANELEKSINLSNLSNGIYILDIVSEKGRMVEKLVKE